MYTNLIYRIKNSRFLQSITILICGTALAQLIGIVTSPLLSRIYTPHDFGTFGTILTISGLISIIASLKFEMAIVLERDDRLAMALQHLCIRLLGISTVILCILIISNYYFLPYLQKNIDLKEKIIWIIPIVLLSTLVSIVDSRLNRERAYKAISKSQIIRRSTIITIQIALGIMGANAAGLIVGNVLGNLIALSVIYLSTKSLFTNSNYYISSNELKVAAYNHRDFAKYTAPQNFMNSLSQSLPVLLLGFFYNEEVAGYYWFAAQLLQAPAGLVGNAVRQVFYREAAEISDDSPKLHSLLVKATTILAVIISPIIIIVFIYGPNLFSIIFGEEWRTAGEYAKWMFLWVGTMFINPPSTSLFMILKKQKISAILDIFLLFIRGGALLYCGYYLDSMTTVIIFSLIGATFNLLLISSWALYFNNIAKKVKV